MTELNLNTRGSLVDKITILFGEFLATGMLLFLGCMGCVATPVIVNSLFQTAVAFGLAVLICIQCFGCVSGAHINPAVTLASLIYNRISWQMALAYFVVQVIGAFLGYGLLKVTLSDAFIHSIHTPNGVCITSIASGVSLWQAVLIEFLITTVLIFICCGIWDPRNAKLHDSVPVRFGLAIVSIVLCAGQFTGASMNPARSLAPALWNNQWEHQWVYWVGPLVAAIFASLVYKYVFRREAPDSVKQTKIAEPLP